MKCYYGEVHSHTEESDGRGTPCEAYDYAREVGGVDFFAVTDHHNLLDPERFASLMPQLAADKEEYGKFAALWGYEMSYSANTGYFGHLNLYGEPYVHPKSIPLSAWYDRIAKSENARLGQFNHPGEKWGDFNEFEYDERIDRIFDLIELRIDEYGIPVIEEEYERCLSKGWHIGPVSNEDTHGGNFTTAREEVGGILAEELSTEAVIDAMKRHRTFATTDGSFKVFFKANGQWLGDILEKTGKLDIEVECSTEKDCGIGLLQLVGERNTVLAQIDARNEKSFIWRISLPDDHKYIYVRRQRGTHYAVTAPVWVEQHSTVSLELSPSFSRNGAVVDATVKNLCGREIEELRITYYTSGGRIYPERDAKRISELGSVSSECEVTDRYEAPLGAGEDRVTVCVSGTCGGEGFFVSRVAYVCPIAISRAIVNTASKRAEAGEDRPAEPFNCFDIHNYSERECDLSEYTFRMYPLHIPRYDDLVINRTLLPHKTLTVWFRNDDSLGVADFNAAHGTSLKEKDLCPVKISFPCPPGVRKILICYGDRTVCRTWFKENSDERLRQLDLFSGFVYGKNFAGHSSDILEINVRTQPMGDFEGKILEGEEMKSANESRRPDNIGKLLCLCDGGEDADAINKRLYETLGKAPEDILLGNNDRCIWMDKYFRTEGEQLLIKAGDSDADTVALMIGGNDCGRGNGAWLDGSNMALPIAHEAICLYLLAMGKRVVLITPVSASAYPEEKLRLEKGLDAAGRTVGAEWSDVSRADIVTLLCR